MRSFSVIHPSGQRQQSERATQSSFITIDICVFQTRGLLLLIEKVSETTKPVNMKWKLTCFMPSKQNQEPRTNKPNKKTLPQKIPSTLKAVATACVTETL